MKAHTATIAMLATVLGAAALFWLYKSTRTSRPEASAPSGGSAFAPGSREPALQDHLLSIDDPAMPSAVSELVSATTTFVGAEPRVDELLAAIADLVDERWVLVADATPTLLALAGPLRGTTPIWKAEIRREETRASRSFNIEIDLDRLALPKPLETRFSRIDALRIALELSRSPEALRALSADVHCAPVFSSEEGASEPVLSGYRVETAADGSVTLHEFLSRRPRQGLDRSVLYESDLKPVTVGSVRRLDCSGLVHRLQTLSKYFGEPQSSTSIQEEPDGADTRRHQKEGGS